MRAKSTSRDLKIYGVAGTHSAILALDYDEKPAPFLGFAIERRDLASGRIVWLEGQKCFKSQVPAPVKGQKYPTHLHPVQGFLWKDFTLVPGRSYEYKVTAVMGTPDNLRYGPPSRITLTAEKEWDGTSGVYFNRGVSGSQSYAERFPAGKISAMDEATRTKALEWLSRGLAEGLHAFIARAAPGETLYCAFYELHEPRTLAALKAAHKSGVEVRIVADGKQYGDDNRAACRAAGMSRLVECWRKKAKIPHNKFMVRCSGAGTPLEVWTGSTNISEKGVFGQCNTGIVVRRRALARAYRDIWQALATDPSRGDLVDAVMAQQDDITLDALPDNSLTVFFSPRRSLAMLDAYAKAVESATSMACGIFPFNVDARFQDAFNTPKDFPRYVIVDRAANRMESADADLAVTAGAYIRTPIDQWLREKSAASLFYGGTDFVHNKILIVDPLGPCPIIVAGSANFSEPSTTGNDENMLVYKGAEFSREADIYFTEFVRLFDHFSFRDWLTSDAADFKPFLEEPSARRRRSWIDRYFDPDSLPYKRTMVFRNMMIPA